MKRTVMQFLGGAIIGGLFGFFIVKGEFTLPLYKIATEMTIVFIVISLLLAIASFIKLAQLKSQSAQQLSGDAEDLREEYLYKLYSDASLASNISQIIGIVAICTGAITEQSIVLIVSSLIIMLLAIAANISGWASIKHAYPHRDFPSINDKHYTKKLLEISDEGERHIMLQGFYSAFSMTNILLLVSLMLLTLYSVTSGESQLFAILIIALILIIVNTQYMLKVRNR